MLTKAMQGFGEKLEFKRGFSIEIPETPFGGGFGRIENCAVYGDENLRGLRTDKQTA
jgi:hypothetical protein